MMLHLPIMKELQLPPLVLVTTLGSEALKDVDVEPIAVAATTVAVLARSMDMDTLPFPLSMLALLAAGVAFQATAGVSVVMDMDLTLADVEARSTLLPLHS